MRIVGLKDMMDAARLAEEKLETACTAQGSYGKDEKPAHKPTIKNADSYTTCMVTLDEKVPNGGTNPNLMGASNQQEMPFQRWTNSELQARRDKGLCY